MEEPAPTVAQLVDELSALIGAMADGSTAPQEVDLTAVCERALDAAGGVELASVLPLLARAVELKAASMLPVPPPDPEPESARDEEAEAAGLARRLAEYQGFADAALALREFERRRQERFGRPEGTAEKRAPSPPAPGEDGDLDRLLAVFAEVWERARPRTARVDRARATVAMAVARVRQRLASAGTVDFAALFEPGADRLEVVVTFLALLELARVGEVAVEQSEPFAPLRITWRGASAPARHGAGAPDAAQGQVAAAGSGAREAEA